jgi:hypothetical protein
MNEAKPVYNNKAIPPEAAELVASASRGSLSFSMRNSASPASPVSKPAVVADRPGDAIVQFEDGTAVCMSRFLDMYAKCDVKPSGRYNAEYSL